MSEDILDGPAIEERRRFATVLAREAGVIALRAFHQKSEVKAWVKESDEIVSNKDIEIDAFIKKRLIAAFPADDVFSEEGGGQFSDTVWVVDPIDGTANFTLGISHWCISIAFCIDCLPVVGVIYDPYHDEIFEAIIGGGALLNGRPLTCQPREKISGAHIGFGYTQKSEPEATFETLVRLAHLGARFRAQGAGALTIAHIAAGRLDGFFEAAIQIWDCAAAMLILKESGGEMAFAFQRENPSAAFALIASRRGVFEDLVAIAVKLAPSPAKLLFWGENDEPNERYPCA